MRRHRNGSDDINLTPLLDVLFCILFLVMLINYTNQNEIESDYQGKIKEATSKIELLQKENIIIQQELDAKGSIEEGISVLGDRAILITIRNRKNAGKHVLEFYEGTDAKKKSELEMGRNRSQYIKDAVYKKIDSYAKESAQRIVFVYADIDQKAIAREEYKAIREAIEGLSQSNKQVFYQMEGAN